MGKIRSALIEPTLDARLFDERGPTAQRMKNADMEIGDTGMITVRQSPMERAVRRGYFTEKQGLAADKLYMHWYRSGCGNDLQSNWKAELMPHGDKTFGYMAKSEMQSFHRQRLRAAAKEVSSKIEAAGQNGQDAVTLLELVVCRDVGFEEAGRKIGLNGRDAAIHRTMVMLGSALNILAKEWGI